MMTSRIAEAVDFMKCAHKGQTRKYTGEPYHIHPLAVKDLLVERVPEVTEDMLIAALLHDVVEDTDVELGDIALEFGEKVATLVYELTTPKTEGRRSVRKAREAARLAKVSPEAQTIKYADIYDNIKDIVANDPEFAPLYLTEKRWLLVKMEDGYGPLRGEVWLKILEHSNARR